MVDRIVIDGSHGEGGGQILRTALALAAVTGRPIRVERIRAGRRNPGLAAQHLTAVRAAARLCDARLIGDQLGSETLDFEPGGTARSGHYLFDVAEAREGGSAGAATLVLQTVLPPLALAERDSTVTVSGGTHVPWSPPFDYARDVWLPALARFGVDAKLDLQSWGWYPAGQGEIRARVRASGRRERRLRSVVWRERGGLKQVRGRAVAAGLPAHIPQRMRDRACVLLARAGIDGAIEAQQVEAASPGAGIFLTAAYAGGNAGFSALGQRGKLAEAVAEEAVRALLANRDAGAVCDVHLGDQVVVPAALATGVSEFSVERASRHLTTNTWVVERFGLAKVDIESSDDGVGVVTISPRQFNLR
ncbi:MAG: RNA 3'-terminal phosphate cyclase [Kiloniellales bacterium]